MAYDPAKDPYTTTTLGFGEPATKVLEIIPDDDIDLAVYPKMLIIVVPDNAVDPEVGFIPMREDDDEAVVILPLPTGTTILPIRVRRVTEDTTAGITVLGGYD